MADDPVIVVGGSLKIKTNGKLRDRGGSMGDYDHRYQNGTITGVEIDGKSYPANKNSTIIIHYEVPDNDMEAE
jgi:hypothetical protein